MSFTIQTLDDMLSFFVGRASTLERRANMFVGLSTTEINPTGSGITEPVGNNYNRTRALATDWNDPYNDGLFVNVDNVAPLQWPRSDGGWGDIRSIFVTTTESGTEPLAFSQLRASSLGGTTFITVNDNDILQMPAISASGGLQFRLSGTGLTNVTRRHLIGHIFNKETWTPPNVLYFGLSETEINVNGGGRTELTGDGYARVPVNLANGFTAPVQLTNSMFTSNSLAITWPQATAQWTLAPYWFASNRQTGEDGDDGDVLMYGTLTDSAGVLWGDSVKELEEFSVGTGLMRVGFNYGTI